MREQEPPGNESPDEESSASEPASIKKVASRGQHTLAIGGNGEVWAWGRNATAQLGDGTVEDRARPKRVQGLNGMDAVAAGYGHSLAMGQGKVWSWGQLGTGERQMRPTEVPGLSDVTAIAAGSNHSLVRHQSGGVSFWGIDSAGKEIDSPMAVSGLPRIEVIAAGGAHSLALDEHDEVWAWGDNSKFQLGRDDVAVSLQPVKVLGLPKIKLIAAGFNHSLALDREGGVWTWGDNTAGQLGDGSLGGARAHPKQVDDLADIKEMAAGTFHSLVRNGNNEVLAWGRNSAGQLGLADYDNLTPKDYPTPQRAFSITSAVSISAGHSHSLAVLSDGCLVAWGSNNDGRLGLPLEKISLLAPTIPAVNAGIIPIPLPVLSRCWPPSGP